jgi:hypothetical protein
MQDMAPRDVRLHPPDVSRVPAGPFFTNMEVTDSDAWPAWSPLESAEHFKHQIQIAIEHLGKLAADVWRFDYVGLALIACLLAVLSRQRDSMWLLLTACIYAGGLLFVVYETRYVLPILLPIALALSLKMADKWEPRFFPFIIAICFAGSAGWGIYSAVSAPHPNLSDRQIARSIADARLGGLFASNTANRDRASCVAFFLNQKFIALPLDLDPAILQSKLDADGVVFLYRWFDSNEANDAEWPEPQVRLLLRDRQWVKQLTIHLDSRHRLDIYRRAAPKSPSTTSALPINSPPVQPAT